TLKDLPEIEYPEEEVYMPEGVEPDTEQPTPAVEAVQSTEQPTEAAEEITAEVKPEEATVELTPTSLETEATSEEKGEEEPKNEIDVPKEDKEEK
ncbi:MAG: hypothetical protein NTY03_17430, partial [Candidatus Bathyarchaeota archaeon]|nr:hypothetical protein [Candidatus Bathyarchaeota archaeon]